MANTMRLRWAWLILTSVLLVATIPPAEAHFAAAHTHTGTVLHQIFEQFGVQTTIVQGKNTYTQNNTTVKDAKFKSKFCDDTGGGWNLLGCTKTMENLTGHVGMYTYGEWHHPFGYYYKQRAHFHAFGSGGFDVWCDIVAGALPSGWYGQCSGNRS